MSKQTFGLPCGSMNRITKVPLYIKYSVKMHIERFKYQSIIKAQVTKSKGSLTSHYKRNAICNRLPLKIDSEETTSKGNLTSHYKRNSKGNIVFQ
jgi:hypothetical protein